ncbi:MAG: 2,5-diamino-6-(ribosylamino)-4(3H)-pyrimidinone 5'-phosphate reductase [Candidatus Njordarchaeia archaeon]
MSVTIWEKTVEIRKIPDWRPYVLVSCAISVDGKLASISGDSRLSSFEDKVEVHKLRSEMDGILVGINTVIKDDPHLTVSEKYYKSERHPIRIILDSFARTPLNAQVITRRSYVPTIIAVSGKAPKDRIKNLEAKGAIIVKAGEGSFIDLNYLLKVLRSRFKIKRLMVEGGGTVISSFFQKKLVDQLRLSLNPIVFGGKDAVSMVQEYGFRNVEEAPKLDLFKIEMAGWSLILHYIVYYKN